MQCCSCASGKYAPCHVRRVQSTMRYGASPNRLLWQKWSCFFAERKELVSLENKTTQQSIQSSLKIKKICDDIYFTTTWFQTGYISQQLTRCSFLFFSCHEENSTEIENFSYHQSKSSRGNIVAMNAVVRGAPELAATVREGSIIVDRCFMRQATTFSLSSVQVEWLIDRWISSKVNELDGAPAALQDNDRFFPLPFISMWQTHGSETKRRPSPLFPTLTFADSCMNKIWWRDWAVVALEFQSQHI